jgi:hypothetical protein
MKTGHCDLKKKKNPSEIPWFCGPQKISQVQLITRIDVKRKRA